MISGAPREKTVDTSPADVKIQIGYGGEIPVGFCEMLCLYDIRSVHFQKPPYGMSDFVYV